MIVGVPKEIKVRESRVSMLPSGARMLTGRGHTVLVESGAGLGVGVTDDEYKNAGVDVVASSDDVWARAEMIVKVKEPLAVEFAKMREGQLIYTYLHLAAAQELGHELLKRKVNSVAYETIETDNHHLPLLQPMSAVAGRMSVQVGATCLQKEHGGKGILLGGVSGVRRGRVTIIGGGTVGSNAARVAMGLGAQVSVFDINPTTLAYLDDIYQGRINTLHSDPDMLAESVRECDLLVGAVLVAGARAPTLVDRKLVSEMEPGSVIVDVAVDQGGCVETCKPTTHDDPTYEVDGVVHYAVANMPGAVARTSTYALCNATIGYAVKLADMGLHDAARDDVALMRGINTLEGRCPHPAVAEALEVPHAPFE